MFSPLVFSTPGVARVHRVRLPVGRRGERHDRGRVGRLSGKFITRPPYSVVCGALACRLCGLLQPRYWLFSWCRYFLFPLPRTPQGVRVRALDSSPDVIEAVACLGWAQAAAACLPQLIHHRKQNVQFAVPAKAWPLLVYHSSVEGGRLVVAMYGVWRNRVGPVAACLSNTQH